MLLELVGVELRLWNIVGGKAQKISQKMVYFNLILAAECLYSADDSVLLAQCMTKLAKPGLRIFVSMGRNRGGEETFVKHINEPICIIMT